MASKYNVPSEIAYYGFPIFYRVECRSGHPTIILSYRQSGKIVYEHPPRRAKDIPAEHLPQKLLEEFLRCLLSLESPSENRERGLNLRKLLDSLPLAVLLLADSYTLFFNPNLERKRSQLRMTNEPLHYCSNTKDKHPGVRSHRPGAVDGCMAKTSAIMPGHLSSG